MKNRRFSIIVPVYNRELFVKECIDSILSQTFSDYEIIAVDDGSTDRTLEVLATYGNRVKTLHQDNSGPDVARALGAAHASGEYVVFLDSDDSLLPWALATYNRIIEEFKSPALIIGIKYYYHDGKFSIDSAGSGDEIEVKKYCDYLSKDVPVGLSCSDIVVRRSAYETIGLRKSTPKTFHADEHDMALRFGSFEPCIIVRRPKTVAYRMHSDNTIKDVKCMVEGVLSLVYAERHGVYPGGSRRRFARYTIIGGMALCWVQRAMEAHLILSGLKLLLIACPMIIAGVVNRLLRFFRRRTPSNIFHQQSR
jgi:glycosyltransferase involved in cell wall biosynthesis